jgi:hypothetical protein
MESPDPFFIHRRIEDMLSYPNQNRNNDVKFVVDESKTQTCSRVQAALSDASNVFAHEGTIKVPNGLWEPTKWMPLFKDALPEAEQRAVAEMLVQKQLPIDALLKVASPAAFGKGGETIFDPMVRKAFEIPGSQLPNDLLDVLKINSIEGVEKTMKPALKKWTYHLYKIHMYGPGGKFEDHADTLHQSNHVATVVLSLPSEHVGGILHVRHHGEAIQFDSSKGPPQDTDLLYGAFFTDCTHSVQEVISGWRVVVQYDVYEETLKEINSDVRKIEYKKSDRGKECYDDYDYPVERVFECLERNRLVGTSMFHDKEQSELIQAVSQYMTTIPPSDGVAFFLRHRYSMPALNELVLKGADRIIYDAFSKREDLSISIQGVLAYFATEEEWPVSVEVKAVLMNDFEDKEEMVNPSINDKTLSTVHIIVDENNGAVRVHNSGRYLGNQAANDHTSYFAACMIIKYID